jgi:hypothetical protein
MNDKGKMNRSGKNDQSNDGKEAKSSEGWVAVSAQGPVLSNAYDADALALEGRQGFRRRAGVGD